MSGAGSSRSDRRRFHLRRGNARRLVLALALAGGAGLLTLVPAQLAAAWHTTMSITTRCSDDLQSWQATLTITNDDASNALTLTSITMPSGIQFSGLTKGTVIPAAKAVSGTASGLSLSLASFPVSLVATWSSGDTAPNSATVTRPVESCARTSTTARSTAAPTTAAPTTAAPTTAAPTTAAPTTAAPTTAAPTTVAPSTAAPTTAASTTVASTTVASTTVVVPATQSGVLGASIVAAPATVAPTSALPKTGSHAGPIAFVGLAMTVVGLTLVRLARPSEQSAN
jgi:hypothetical protein